MDKFSIAKVLHSTETSGATTINNNLEEMKSNKMNTTLNMVKAICKDETTRSNLLKN